MTTPINDTPVLTGKDIVQSLFFSGISLDSSQITLHQKKSHQEFIRDDVLISQSIDPYQLIVNANKIVASGESLFFNEKKVNKRK